LAKADDSRRGEHGGRGLSVAEQIPVHLGRSRR
jgi:hypothetical protein